jgi:CubicO group peptidase (beta-lactamase class C family)
MNRPRLRSTVGLVAAFVLAVGLGLGTRGESVQAGQSVFPAAEWQRIADPKTAGYCSDKLDLATARVKELGTTAMMAVVGGRELWSYGDLQTISYLASVRKSILAMMYGKYVASGQIKLEKTLADLGIDDHQALVPAEKEATVADLLAARSGVYHPAANAACTGCGGTMGDPPGPRGSTKHGTYFLYNNWDFNALGTIFEQETKQDLYDAFERDLARPLGLQDFDRSTHKKSGDGNASRHLAYHFNLSTRDMARIGYVMLRDGQWAGKTIVPRDWAKRIVTPVTRLPDMHPASLTKGPFGYGFLWWIWDGSFNQGPYAGAYTGSGAVGQFITVLPALDMVVAHKTRPGGRSVSSSQYIGVIDAIIAARCSAD